MTSRSARLMWLSEGDLDDEDEDEEEFESDDEDGDKRDDREGDVEGLGLLSDAGFTTWRVMRLERRRGEESSSVPRICSGNEA